MTDLFPFDEPETWSVNAATDVAVVRAPLPILGAAYVALTFAGLSFLLPGRTFNFVGYFVSVILVTALVIWFRTVDRQRRRASTYAHIAGLRWLTGAPLVLGIVVAAGHAVFMAQSKSIA